MTTDSHPERRAGSLVRRFAGLPCKRQITNNEKLTTNNQRWFILLVILLIALLLLVLSPALANGLVNDDFIEVGARHFDALDSLPKENWALWGSRFVQRALIDPVTDWEIFRPTRQLVFWANYFMWHLDPLGYRLSNLLLALSTCLVVALIEFRLTRRRAMAAVAGVVFALYPLHVIPVLDISAIGHILAGLFVALCVLYYMLPGSRRNVLLAYLFCLLAMGSKETALTTPALLLLYEIIYRREDIRHAPRAFVMRQLPFWLFAVAIIALRLVLFGKLSNSPADFTYWYQSTSRLTGYIQLMLMPFVRDITDAQAILAVGVILLLMWVYRARREVLFGFLWLPLALGVSILFPPTDRYFFTPSIGIALAFGSILARPWTMTARWARVAAALFSAAILVALALGSYSRAADYRTLGIRSQNFFNQLQTLHPDFPRASRLFFVGFPQRAQSGILIQSSRQMQYAAQLLYDDRSLRAVIADKFPDIIDSLNRTFYFEYSGRKLAERADIVQALRDRRRCADSPDNAIRWSFDRDTEGWQAWSGIDSFDVRNDALSIHTNDNDPFMASPYIQVSPDDLDRIEIKMSARSSEPLLHAELYWKTPALDDFSPQARQLFQVPADGIPHTFNLSLNPDGTRDPIVRLRLDPADAPADITLNSITIYCRQ